MRAMSLGLAASVAAAAAVCVTSAAGNSGRVTATGTPTISGRDTITTVAGGGSSVADGVPATSALFRPSPYTGMAIAVDAHDNLYIADTGNQRVREVSAADGKIRT